jgi:hypothetical protein
MTTIDTVSAASAVRAAVRNGSPPAISGRIVSPYPKMKARTIARRIEGRSCQPRAVDRTRPRISPMPQPVRQWTVAWNAVRFRESGAAPV